MEFKCQLWPQSQVTHLVRLQGPATLTVLCGESFQGLSLLAHGTRHWCLPGTCKETEDSGQSSVHGQSGLLRLFQGLHPGKQTLLAKNI